MDEMKMVRELLAEPPPAPHVVAEGRERLLGPPAGARGTRGIPRSAFRTALRLTGAAAVAALAVATLLPRAGTAPGVGDLDVPDGSVRNVLLAAAARAESAPTSGVYWQVRSMSGSILPQKFGRGDNRYSLEQLSVTVQWTKRNGRSWLGRRDWVRPKSSGDEAAWQRDGSPSKWCMGKTDTEPPEPICLHTAPGTASVRRAGDDEFVVVEGRDLSFAQLQRLPTEPDALRAWVVDAAKADLDPSVPSDILDFNVADVLTNLLVAAPVPPEVRAAAYRALADMPNVKNIGPTRDALGRAGVGIRIDAGDFAGVFIPGVPGGRPFSAGELTRKLIIDPDTSQVLADQARVGASSDPVGGSLILKVGWTNQRPHKPAVL